MGNQKDLKSSLDKLAQHVKQRIDHTLRQADEYTKTMNEDYERFFIWNSEDMYKMQELLRCYREFWQMICTGEPDRVLEYLACKVKSLSIELLENSPRQKSTNAMSSLACTLIVEVKQELLREFRMLLDDINK